MWNVEKIYISGVENNKWFWDIRIEKSENVHDIMANHANQSKRPPQAEILFFGAWKAYFQAILLVVLCLKISKFSPPGGEICLKTTYHFLHVKCRIL